MSIDHKTIERLSQKARSMRRSIVRMVGVGRAGHLGGSLSITDVVASLYFSKMKLDKNNPRWEKRDYFLLSKGHAAAALFSALYYKGFISQDLLHSYGQAGSCLEEHPGPKCAPGVEAATGSLGHGLSMGIGMALAGRILNCQYRVMVLLSDGECNEGSVWEGAMFAASQCLDNVCVVVDFNKWQATGRSCEVMALEPLVEKWKAFGWSAYEIDGHDMDALVQLLTQFPDGSDKPMAVVAHTVKGKGVSFMEDDNNWHYRIPTIEEVAAAKKELRLL